MRVYTISGRVAHILAPGCSSYDTCAASLCGRTTWPQLWRGVGVASEVKRAIALPTCRLCKAFQEKWDKQWK